MIIFNEILNNETIQTMCRYLNEGYALLIKTDTQWGLIALEPNILYKIKKRPLNKKIVRLVGPNFKFGNLSEPQKMFVREFWPGPVTIVLNGDAYRLVNKKFINAIILTLGRMVYCTSANISGSEPINSIEEALIVFNHAIDDIVLVSPLAEDLKNDQNTLSSLPPLPSTIVDIDYWYIIRKGSKYLEVLNYIANKIIPYYQNELDEHENKILAKEEEVLLINKADYQNTPIVDLVWNTSPTIRRKRKEQFNQTPKTKKRNKNKK